VSAAALGHDELRELLAAYAVAAVSAEERAIVEAHLTGCEECLGELAGQLAALAALTSDVRLPPDPASWEAVRARIEVDAEPATPARVASLPRRALPRLVGGAAIVACAVAVTLVVTHNGAGSAQMTAPIVSAEPATALAGSVKLFDPGSNSGHVVVDLRNVPAAPAGHHYEVWVKRSGQGAEMEAIGAFMPEDGRASLSLGLPGPGEYVALDISIQEDAGPPEHSGASLGGATLSS